MRMIAVCSECEGRGEYEIFNAYDIERNEMLECEHCSGSGFLNVSPEAVKKRLEELKN